MKTIVFFALWTLGLGIILFIYYFIRNKKQKDSKDSGGEHGK